MKVELSSEIVVLREIASAVAREPNVRRLLEEALSRHNGNRSVAGRELGISPRMMCYKMKKSAIEQ